MSKAFRQVTDKPEEAEVITLEWAVNTSLEYLGLMSTYMDCCAKSDDPRERLKYLESAEDALGHIVIANQMIGALLDEATLTDHIFGKIPVEIVEWSPSGE